MGLNRAMDLGFAQIQGFPGDMNSM